MLLTKLSAACRRAAAWIERHPRRAWLIALLLVLLPAAWETSRPTPWRYGQDAGVEVRVTHPIAARAGWKELASYWTGRFIQGNDYYQPLTSWLFVAEQRLWGNDDGAWAALNRVLHPLCVVVLAWTATLFVGGSLPRRLGAGVIAGLLFGAPGLAHRLCQDWVIGWWPAQPDLLSLVFGLLTLACVCLFVRTEDRRLARLALLSFFIGVCFKETAYTAGVGACLLLLRHRKHWGVLAEFAACGLLLFTIRSVALGGRPAYGTDNDPHRVAGAFLGFAAQYAERLRDAAVPVMLLAAGMGLPAVSLRKRPGGERAALAAALVLAGGALLYSPPWEADVWRALARALEVLLWVLLLGGLALALRRWPWPELLLIYAMNLFLALCFALALAWHAYWSDALGSVLAAGAAVHLLSAVKSVSLRVEEEPNPAPGRGRAP